VGDGFVEVLDNKVKVLVDFAEFAEEIDLKRAEAARDRAKERLEQRKKDGMDVARAEAALRRALVRLKLSGRG
jgi:F-type H+-transporting ATPase subunit epsilon